jgi:hypothetical protein
VPVGPSQLKDFGTADLRVFTAVPGTTTGNVAYRLFLNSFATSSVFDAFPFAIWGFLLPPNLAKGDMTDMIFAVNAGRWRSLEITERQCKKSWKA